MALALATITLIAWIPISVRADVLAAADSLRDIHGNRRDLGELTAGARATVLVFLASDCPGSKELASDLASLARGIDPEKVRVLAIYSSAADTVSRMAASMQDLDLPFPALFDRGALVAGAARIERTPASALLDRAGNVLWRSGLNATLARGGPKSVLAREALAAADGLPPGQTELPQAGSPLARPEPLAEGREIAFTTTIAPIFRRRCAGCHRPAGQAPFALTAAADIREHLATIEEAIADERMPPWIAAGPLGEFSNDRRLSPVESETLLAWLKAGGVGLESRRPETGVEESASSGSRWTIGEPDLVIESPVEFTIPATGGMDFLYSVLPEEQSDRIFDAERWVEAAEILPTSRSVSHHMVVFLAWPGSNLNDTEPPFFPTQVLGVFGWVPGDPKFTFPPGSALRVPKGARVQFEAHYTPSGRETTDRPAIAFRFAKRPPDREIRLVMPMNADLVIPPGDPHYRATFGYTFPADARLLAINPHMHLRGKSFASELRFPDGGRRTLLKVPRYDFEWQGFYFLKDPLPVPAGTRLDAVGHFDNSRCNLFNPDPEASVPFGMKTAEEMLLAWLVIDIPRGNDPNLWVFRLVPDAPRFELMILALKVAGLLVLVAASGFVLHWLRRRRPQAILDE